MRHISVFALIVFFLAGGSPLACAQSADEEVDRERIIENLKHQIPQLRQAEALTLGAMTSSEVPGFRQATLTINGRNQVPVLVRDDGEQVLLLAGPPIDASRSVDELQAERAAETEAQRATLAEAIDGRPVRGAADAPVTMVAFSDFQCPYCAESTSLIDEVLDRYDGQVNFVFLHYPLPNHDWAKPASIAAQCAAEQDEEAFWALHDAYFVRQDEITEGNLIDETADLLQGTNVDLDAWRTCATDPSSDAYRAAEGAVEASMQTGQQLGVRGTPTFFIDGEQMQGARSVEAFGARIEEAAQ